MKYQTSIDGDDAVIRTNRPAEVARQLLAATDDPAEVRTLTVHGVSFRVPLHLAEAAGFVDYPKDTSKPVDAKPAPSPAATGTNDESPTGNTQTENKAATEATSGPKPPRRNGTQESWSKFLTEQGIEHDENSSRDALVGLWDERAEG